MIIMARKKNGIIKKETVKQEIAAKLEKHVETPPQETVSEKCCDKPTESKTNYSAWILALVFGAMVILALSYGYNNVLEKNILKKGCGELSNSPELKYPTVCVPLDTDSNRGDYVDTKSNPMCRCKVDMGNGTSTVIDIRLAK